MKEDSKDEREAKRKVHSRWTDNPFRDPNATPEQLEWIEKRDQALSIYRETGDDTMAIEIGLFPTPEEEERARKQAQLAEDTRRGQMEFDESADSGEC